jgi:hypothetical protein
MYDENDDEEHRKAEKSNSMEHVNESWKGGSKLFVCEYRARESESEEKIGNVIKSI